MPAQMPAWANAMRTVAQLDRSGHAPVSTWGYWVPEPSLLLNSSTRRERYVMNWLRIRDGWLYLLRSRDTRPTQVPTQWWRDFLYGDPDRPHPHSSTRNAKRQRLIMQVFGDLFQEDDLNLDTQANAVWFGHRFTAIRPELCPLIMWELFELGFRHELLALDRHLCPNTTGEAAEVSREQLLAGVFPHHDLLVVSMLPKDAAGLCALLPERRVSCLEVLRRVVSRWPGCPQEIRVHPPLTTMNSRNDIEAVEEMIAIFYVRSFFSCAGRAPLIPHMYPALNDI